MTAPVPPGVLRFGSADFKLHLHLPEPLRAQLIHPALDVTAAIQFGGRNVEFGVNFCLTTPTAGWTPVPVTADGRQESPWDPGLLQAAALDPPDFTEIQGPPEVHGDAAAHQRRWTTALRGPGASRAPVDDLERAGLLRPGAFRTATYLHDQAGPADPRVSAVLRRERNAQLLTLQAFRRARHVFLGLRTPVDHPALRWLLIQAVLDPQRRATYPQAAL